MSSVEHRAVHRMTPLLITLSLKLESMKHEVYLQICHISGDRMSHGVDGWSWGDIDSGVSMGYDLQGYPPGIDTKLQGQMGRKGF